MLVNQEWLSAQFNSTADVLTPGLNSDHSPCVVTLTEHGSNPIRPFRFYNMWSSHPQFQEIVREVWAEEYWGTKQYILCKKLKSLKKPLKQLNARAFSHISERAEQARMELDKAQKQMYDLPENEQVKIR